MKARGVLNALKGAYKKFSEDVRVETRDDEASVCKHPPQFVKDITGFGGGPREYFCAKCGATWTQERKG